MLFTKKQYEYLHNLFQEISNKLIELQNSIRDSSNRQENKSIIDRTLYTAKIAAYEDCYNLFRKFSNKFYAEQSQATDIQLEKLFDSIYEQFQVFEMLQDKSGDDANNLLLMMRNTIQKIKLLFDQQK